MCDGQHWCEFAGGPIERTLRFVSNQLTSLQQVGFDRVVVHWDRVTEQFVRCWYRYGMASWHGSELVQYQAKLRWESQEVKVDRAVIPSVARNRASSLNHGNFSSMKTHETHEKHSK
jgi:hypothetical protein